MTTQFKPGDKVWYSGDFGEADEQAGTITNRGEKNGQEVYGVTLANGETKWGYTDQFRKRM